MSKLLRFTSPTTSGIIQVRAQSAIWTINLANIERHGVYPPRIAADFKTVIFRWHNGPYSEQTQITMDSEQDAFSLLHLIV